MRITINIESTLDIQNAIVALNHFIKNKKPDDSTNDIWAMKSGGMWFEVGVKKNGNYSVIKRE